MKTNRMILSLAVVAGLIVSGGVGGASASAATAGPSLTDPNAAAVHASTQNAGQVAKYWTPERMRTARPAPEPTAGAFSRPQSHTLPATSAPGSLPAKATGAATGPRATADVGAQAISRSLVWSDHKSMPATTVGKLFFSDSAGGLYECSASVITSPNRSLIWTAGHCVTDGKRHWYTNFLFVPNYPDTIKPYNWWSWKSVSTPRAYFDGGNLDYDFAAMTLWPRYGKRVADATGSQGFMFGYGYRWNNTYEFGYPYSTHPSRAGITGQQLRYCIGNTWRVGNQQAIHCDQGSGASGGPWLYDLKLDRGWGYLIGNVSHHHSSRSDVEHSPHFGDAAINVYDSQKNR